jgi:hypothetical protein
VQAQSRTAFRVLRRHYRVLPQRLVDVFPVPFPRRPVICAGQNHWQHRRACCASGTGRLSSEEGVCLAARSRGRGEPRPVGRVDQNVRRWCRTLGWSVSRSSRSARRSEDRPICERPRVELRGSSAEAGEQRASRQPIRTEVWTGEPTAAEALVSLTRLLGTLREQRSAAEATLAVQAERSEACLPPARPPKRVHVRKTHSGITTTPSLGFVSFRRMRPGDRCAGLPRRHRPSSGFLTLSTVYSHLDLVALFRATSAHRILAFRAFPTQSAAAPLGARCSHAVEPSSGLAAVAPVLWHSSVTIGLVGRTSSAIARRPQQCLATSATSYR